MPARPGLLFKVQEYHRTLQRAEDAKAWVYLYCRHGMGQDETEWTVVGAATLREQADGDATWNLESRYSRRMWFTDSAGISDESRYDEVMAPVVDGQRSRKTLDDRHTIMQFRCPDCSRDTRVQLSRASWNVPGKSGQWAIRDAAWRERLTVLVESVAPRIPDARIWVTDVRLLESLK